MAEKLLAHPVSEMGQEADELKLIHGIGPALEKRMYAAGIRTFAQLAATTPRQLADLFKDMTGLSEDRIAKQNWIGQAHDLTEANLQARQHYALFSVELLLDEENNVKRTLVNHGQANEKSWAGWNAAGLARYIEDQAMLRVIPETASAPETAAHMEPVMAGNPATSPAKPQRLSGDLRLTKVEMVAAGEPGPLGSLRASQPYSTLLLLDLNDVATTPKDVPFQYSAAVYLKKLDSGPHLAVNKAQGELSLSPAKKAQIDVEGQPLQAGIYQMDVLVSLYASSEASESTPGSRITAMTEGRLLQVY